MSVKIFTGHRINYKSTKELIVSHILHMAHNFILINMLCLSLARSYCLFISIHPPPSHIAVVAVITLTLLCCLRRHYRCRHIRCHHCRHRPCHYRPFVASCRSRHRLDVVCLGFWSICLSPWANLDSFKKNTQKQSANKAAINVAIADLVAARKVRHADGGKRLIKSNHSYKNGIASLQSVGVDITYDALMKRVWWKKSIYSLSDPRFLEPFRMRRIKTVKKDKEKKSKRKALNIKLVSAVKVLRAKWGHEKIHSFQ